MKFARSSRKAGTYATAMKLINAEPKNLEVSKRLYMLVETNLL